VEPEQQPTSEVQQLPSTEKRGPREPACRSSLSTNQLNALFHFHFFIHNFTPTYVSVLLKTIIRGYKITFNLHPYVFTLQSQAFCWFVDSELLNKMHGEVNIKFQQLGVGTVRVLYGTGPTKIKK
jgi:hypothetical protein